MVDFGESDKMIKISGKVDKSIFRSLLIEKLHQTKHFCIFLHFRKLRKK